MTLLDVSHNILASATGLVVRRTQEVTSDHLDALSDERMESASTRSGEMHRVASVPVALVEQWLAEGFDVYRESAKAIVARLRRDDLGAFIATSKRV